MLAVVFHATMPIVRAAQAAGILGQEVSLCPALCCARRLWLCEGAQEDVVRGRARDVESRFGALEPSQRMRGQRDESQRKGQVPNAP